MWAWWGKQFHEPKCGSGHVCRVMVWTKHQGLVPYTGFEKVRGDLSICGGASIEHTDYLRLFIVYLHRVKLTYLDQFNKYKKVFAFSLRTITPHEVPFNLKIWQNGLCITHLRWHLKFPPLLKLIFDPTSKCWSYIQIFCNVLATISVLHHIPLLAIRQLYLQDTTC